MKFLTVIVASLLLVGVGCEEDHDHEHDNNHVHENNGEHDPEEEGCEHMGDGPFASITAQADAAGTLENAAVEHTRVDIALVDYEGSKGGLVQFEAAEAGDFIFFLSDDVSLSVTDGAGVAKEAEVSTGESTLCPGVIAASHTFDLEVGTYTITVGPTELETVGLVYEVGEHGAE